MGPIWFTSTKPRINNQMTFKNREDQWRLVLQQKLISENNDPNNGQYFAMSHYGRVG